MHALVPDGKSQIEDEPKYSKEGRKLVGDVGGQIGETGWAKAPAGKSVVPSTLLWAIVMAEHRKSHWRVEVLYAHLLKIRRARNMYTSLKQVTQQCEICLQNNPKVGPRAQLGQIGKGDYPGQQWQIGFSELPRKGGFRYLLVMSDTFSGWPEAFPCRSNKAKKITKILLQEIIPRFGMPATISSD